MKYLEIIKETLEQWDGNWVHYSDQPYMKATISKQSHQDPAGIYLFPEKFNPINMWKNKRYKFIVKLDPSIKILDVAKLSKEEVENFTKYMIGDKIEKYHALNNEYPIKNEKDYFDRAWDILRAHFSYEGGFRQFGLFNKKIREYGYDAIFDDTLSIHCAEIQLLVLNPTKIKIIQMVERKNNAYTKITNAMKTLENILKEFGNVKIDQPKLNTSYGKKELIGYVNLSIGEQFEYPHENYHDNKYMNFKLAYDSQRNVVNIHLLYSNPRLDYGVGALITDDNDKKEWDSLIRDVHTWVKMVNV